MRLRYEPASEPLHISVKQLSSISHFHKVVVLDLRISQGCGDRNLEKGERGLLVHEGAAQVHRVRGRHSVIDTLVRVLDTSR